MMCVSNGHCPFSYICMKRVDWLCALFIIQKKANSDDGEDDSSPLYYYIIYYFIIVHCTKT